MPHRPIVSTSPAEPECPSCHTVAGHPHTDYCRASSPACSAPARDHGDGRGCEDETCPRHGHPAADAPCSGQCLSGYDIGIPGPGIAYPHPDCPAHGDSWVPGENEWSRQYVADHPARFQR